MAPLRIGLPWALFACLAGCNGEVDSDPPRMIALDQPTYESTYLSGDSIYQRFGFRVIATVTNERTTPMELTRCTPEASSPMYGLVPVAGEEETAYSAASGCVGGTSPFVIQPGATRVDTLFPSGPNAWAGTPRQPVGSLEGEVELWVQEAGCDAGCEPVRSRPFVVRLAQR